MGVFYTGSGYQPVLFFGTTAKGICFEVEPKQLITVWWVAGNELPPLMILLTQGSILPLFVNILRVLLVLNILSFQWLIAWALSCSVCYTTIPVCFCFWIWWLSTWFERAGYPYCAVSPMPPFTYEARVWDSRVIWCLPFSSCRYIIIWALQHLHKAVFGLII